MFKARLLQKQALPEVARFDGMKVTVYYDDHSDPHIHVYIAGEKTKLSLPELKVLDGPELSSVNRRKLERWAATPVPNHEPKEDGSPFRVADWLADAFRRSIGHQHPGHVSTPAEITKQIKAQNKPTGPKKEAHRGWSYWVDQATPLKDYKLRVTFHGGETKIVDIKKMCWGYRCFTPIFQNFFQVRNEGSYVWWPLGDDEVEISAENLFLRRKPLERSPPDPDFSLDLNG